METTTGNINIPIVRDVDDTDTPVDLLEGGETLTVTLTEVSTDAGVVRLGTPSEATTTVRDYGSTVTVSVNVVEPVPEGNAATFTVSLSGLVSQDLVVDYATANGTATAADYRSQAQGTLTIAAEQSEGTITVDTLEDTVAEASETFTVTLMLSGQPDNVVLGKAAATAMIGDNDALEVALLGPDNVAEGSAATYTVRLSGGTSSEDVVIDYQVRGNATRVEDYKVPSGTTTAGLSDGFDGSLTIPAGATTGTLEIQTIADADTEVDETLIVQLVEQTDKATKAGVVGISSTLGSQTTTIASAETVTVSLAADSATVREGTRATFTVRLSGTTSNEVIVPYGTTPSSSPDYTPVTNANAYYRGRAAPSEQSRWIRFRTTSPKLWIRLP